MAESQTRPAQPVRIPAEWEKQQAIWTAFPSAADLWLENLDGAQKEVAAMILALAQAGRVNVLAMGDDAIGVAQKLCAHKNVTIIPANFGDIWLRDTGPIFAIENGKKVALGFKFNGWGGKYELPHDDEVSAFVAEQSGATFKPHPFVMEGGALEFDGAGTIITTKECLLNENRNPDMNADEIETAVKAAFGANKIIWIEGGLLNDHTDGHVDNIVRFIAPGHALCQSPHGDDDPNTDVLNSIAAELKAAGLKVSTIPSAGLVTDEDGEPVAASHMNYIIFNQVIVMPMYDVAKGAKAAEALGKLFPDHQIIALSARRVLTGGGSFHCITQQEF